MQSKTAMSDTEARGAAAQMLNVRKTLDRLIRESGIGYAGASRLIGKNPAYIQQFIKRGTPRTLAEDDRRALAMHFGVSEEALGAAPVAPRQQGGRNLARPSPPQGDFLYIPYINNSDEKTMPITASLAADLGGAAVLAALRVAGDAMAPTLLDDDILIINIGESPLRDGLYLIDMNGVPAVKRIAIEPGKGQVSIISDNSAYPDFTNFPGSKLRIMGRVVWIGRFLS